MYFSKEFLPHLKCSFSLFFLHRYKDGLQDSSSKESSVVCVPFITCMYRMVICFKFHIFLVYDNVHGHNGSFVCAIFFVSVVFIPGQFAVFQIWPFEISKSSFHTFCQTKKRTISSVCKKWFFRVGWFFYHTFLQTKQGKITLFSCMQQVVLYYVCGRAHIVPSNLTAIVVQM